MDVPEFALPRSLAWEICQALGVDFTDVVEIVITQSSVRLTVSYPIADDPPAPNPWAEADPDAEAVREDARWSGAVVRDPFLKLEGGETRE